MNNSNSFTTSSAFIAICTVILIFVAILLIAIGVRVWLVASFVVAGFGLIVKPKLTAEKNYKQLDDFDPYGQTMIFNVYLPEEAVELINKGADVNARDIKGRTPMHVHVDEDRASIVAQLLLSRADPDPVDNNGFTPLFFAKSLEVAERLIKAGADPNHTNKEGVTVLDYLVSQRDRFQSSAVKLKKFDDMLEYVAAESEKAASASSAEA